MRSLLFRALLGFLVIGVVSIFLSIAATPCAAQTDEIHLSLVPRPGTGALGASPGNGIPWNCSTWHELYPSYCASHHQDAYYDNGDGVVSPCDLIKLDGICYHITWVGPTYYMSLPGAPPVVAEPEVRNSGENPVCETWHEVYPHYCYSFHVDSWHDNGNGVLDACDEVDFVPYGSTQQAIYHIDRIALDIKVVPAPLATPTDPNSWGRLKSLYYR